MKSTSCLAFCMSMVLVLALSPGGRTNADVTTSPPPDFSVFDITISPEKSYGGTTAGLELQLVQKVSSYETWSFDIAMENSNSGVPTLLASLPGLPPVGVDAELIALLGTGTGEPISLTEADVDGILLCAAEATNARTYFWMRNEAGEWQLDPRFSITTDFSLMADAIDAIHSVAINGHENAAMRKVLLIDSNRTLIPENVTIYPGRLEHAILDHAGTHPAVTWLGMTQAIAKKIIPDVQATSTQYCGNSEKCDPGSAGCDVLNDAKCTDDDDDGCSAASLDNHGSHAVAPIDSIKLANWYAVREALRQTSPGRKWVRTYYVTSARLSFGFDEAVTYFTAPIASRTGPTIDRFLRGDWRQPVVGTGFADDLHSLLTTDAFANQRAADPVLDALLTDVVTEAAAVVGIPRWRLYERYQLPAPDLSSPVDLDNSGIIDAIDISLYLNAFANNQPQADFAEPFGIISSPDLVEFLSRISDE